MYVLIIMTWFAGYVSGYAVTTQEFTSEPACIHAAEMIAQMGADAGTKPKIKCVQR